MAFLNKIGRKAAGTWGRPCKAFQKRQSAKGIRRHFKKTLASQ